MEPRWLVAYHDMLRRLEAEEALLATQVTFMPYLKESKRGSVIRGWEKETKPKQPGKQYDRHGREVVDNVEDFTRFLRSFGVM